METNLHYTNKQLAYNINMKKKTKKQQHEENYNTCTVPYGLFQML